MNVLHFLEYNSLILRPLCHSCVPRRFRLALSTRRSTDLPKRVIVDSGRNSVPSILGDDAVGKGAIQNIVLVEYWLEEGNALYWIVAPPSSFSACSIFTDYELQVSGGIATTGASARRDAYL
ncbi:hypothetical protein PTI98_013269 [Pleurotus ostreatus]|nr:hypothetical protein PTI98_013269 [Pleurotus ostreatus]